MKDANDELKSQLKQRLEGLSSAQRNRLKERLLGGSPGGANELDGSCLSGPVMGGVGEKCLHEIVEEQIGKTPQAVAVEFGGHRLTFRDLDDRANELATHLRSLGVGPGVHVGIFMERSIELVVGIYGTLKAGGAYLPLDPGYPQKRLDFMIEDSSIEVLLTQEGLAGRLPDLSVPALYLDKDWDSLEREDAPSPRMVVGAEDPAYLIYTSGTSGRPKGARIPHRAIVNHMLWMRETFPTTSEDKILQKTPVSADASVWEFFLPLISGSRLVLAEPDEHLDLSALARKIIEEEITIIQFVPSLLSLFVNSPLAGECKSLKRIFAGGEALQAGVVAKVHRKLSADVINLYGPTETTIDSTYWICKRDPDTKRIPIGRPIANTTLFVVDDKLQPVSVGKSGELCIAGAGVGMGYWNLPELTDTKFVPELNAHDTESRMYRTGDKCRLLSNGSVEFLGRIDDQIQVRGFRIELSEVEHTLSKATGVESCLANGWQVNPDEIRLVAYVQLNRTEDWNEEALRHHMREALPSQFVPSHFIEVDDWPMLPNGKVDRKALPLPEREVCDSEGEEVLTPLEKELSGLFCEVLGYNYTGKNEDFFTLGGHSLSAIKLSSMIGKQLGHALPIRIIFKFPTISAIANWIENSGVKAPSPSDPVSEVGGGTIIPQQVSQEDVITGSAPLSHQQEGLWFIDRMQAGSPEYNIAKAIRIEGCLDIAALEAALELLTRRHESLRTTFEDCEEGTVQKIHSEMRIPLEVGDFQSTDHDRVQTEISASLQNLRQHVFDLEKGPLFRVILLRVSDTDHVLAWICHHIIWDGWSTGVFYRELGEAYSGFLSGSEPGLDPLTVQYADFCHWQHDRNQGAVLRKNQDFWMDLLKNPSTLNLPVDFPRQAKPSNDGAAVDFTFSNDLSRKLSRFCRSQGVTPYMTLMGAYQVLMNRYTGQDDILVGSPYACRSKVEIEKLIGYFVNMVVHRGDFSEPINFEQLVARVAEYTQKSFIHQDHVFSKLVQSLNPPRMLNRPPVFQVTLAVQNAVGVLPSMKGLKLSPINIPSIKTHFDVEIHLWQSEKLWTGNLIYRTDLFTADTIEKLSEHFQILLENLIDAPEKPVKEVSSDIGSDKAKGLEGTKHESSSYQRDASISAIFESQVKRNPHALALEEDDRSLSYAEVNQLANLLAKSLGEAGVERGDRVGLYLDRSIELVVGMLAILKRGAAYVPLAKEYPIQRLKYMVKDAGLRVVFSDGEWPEGMSDETIRILDPKTLLREGSGLDDKPPLRGALATDPAYVIYTSGTTGEPKGVVVPHRGVLRLVCSQVYVDFNSHQRFLFLSSPSFDASTFEIWGPLLNGGTCVIFNQRYPDLEILAEAIREKRVTCLWLTAGLFNLIVDTHLHLLEPVDHILTGGEALSTAHVKKVLRAYPHLQLTNGYGPTESTTFACTHAIELGNLEDSVPIGRPIAHTRAYILDADMNEVGAGVPGELYLGGDGLAIEYLGQPKLTAEKFVPDPFSVEEGSRLYRTGDRCRVLPDGLIEFLGRTDRQIKVRGYRLELGEVEASLMEHPGVAQCVTMANDLPGETVQVIAYFVPVKGTASLDASLLRSFMLERSPDYAVPAIFIEIASMPLTPNGKVDLNALPKVSPAKEPGNLLNRPTTPEERLLLGIWEELFQFEGIGCEDNFFDLGGHSLLASRMVAAIKRATGTQLPIAALFEAPTIRAIAKRLASECAPSINQSIVTLQPKGSLSPLFCLHGWGGDVYGFLDLAQGLAPDRPVYGVQAVGLDGLSPRHTSVEQMAEHYYGQIQSVDPDGPYHLIGYSAGGWIAYAVAQKFLKEGKQVKLYMLDTGMSSRIPYALFALAKCIQILHRTPHHIWHWLRIPFREKVAYIKSRFDWFLVNLRRTNMTRNEEKERSLSEGKKTPDGSDYFALVAARYRPERYKGDLVLFVPRGSHAYMRFFWKYLIIGKVQLHFVDGNHFEMIDRKNIGNFVSIFCDILKKDVPKK